jgi:hypothetical protein
MGTFSFVVVSFLEVFVAREVFAGAAALEVFVAREVFAGAAALEVSVAREVFAGAAACWVSLRMFADLREVFPEEAVGCSSAGTGSSAVFAFAFPGFRGEDLRNIWMPPFGGARPRPRAAWLRKKLAVQLGSHFWLCERALFVRQAAKLHPDRLPDPALWQQRGCR